LVEEELDGIGDIELVGGLEDEPCVFEYVKIELFCVVELLDLFGQFAGL
jgi:hypothetical protein